MSERAPISSPSHPSIDREKIAAVSPRAEISRGRAALGAAILFATTLVIYFPALHGEMLWDDEAHVTKENLRDVGGLTRIWTDMEATQQYYPLLHSAFWLEWRLWGEDTLYYHLVSVLLHATSACLVWAILRRLEVPGAYLAAAIFAVHPVHVESVAWISELKNTLSGVFYLTSLWCYLGFDEERKPSAYASATLLFVLGLATKTVIATLPAALLVIFWWRRGRLGITRDVAPLVPWFLLSAVSGIATAVVEYQVIGAQGSEFALSFLQRCQLAGKDVWFYFGKLFYPVKLLFIYPRWELNASHPGDWLATIGLVVVLIGLWLLRRFDRGPLACVLFFVGTLFPVLGFLNVYPFKFSFVADHFQYLASLGIITLVAALASVATRRLPANARWLGQAACAATVFLLAGLAFAQAGLYESRVALYEWTLSHNQHAWLMHDHLGGILEKKEKHDEAAKHYRLALEDAPRNVGIHNNLGEILRGQGQLDEAREQYEAAIAIDPLYPEAHSNLGILLDSEGRTVDALYEFHAALAIRPDFPEAHDGLGNTLVHAGRREEARKEFLEATRLRPNNVSFWINLAVCSLELKLFSEALLAGERALGLAKSSGQTITANEIESLLQVTRQEMERAGGSPTPSNPQPSE